jgi:Domain of unknown function (DUF4349)
MFRRSLQVGRPHRTVPTFILLLAAAALLAACSGPTSMLSAVGGPIGDVAQPGGEPAQPVPMSGNGESDTGNSTAARDVAGPHDDALIVRTAQLGLQVADVDAALSKAQQAVGGLGGYIGASTRSLQDDQPVATVTYRVPVERWDEALTALRGLATKVLSEQTDAMEVTAQAVDLDARIKNLRATETALQGVLEKAVKIPDILEVQAQLSQTREQIEQLVAQRAELGDRAALGTVQVAYGIEVVAVTQATQSWDPAAEVDQATATLVDILQTVASVGIWFTIVLLPLLVVVAIVGLVVAFIARRRGVLRRPGPPATFPAAGADG